MTTLGEQFARALAAKDFGRVAELLQVDRDRVAWRFAVSTPDGRISWMRVLCSGFRPAPPE